MADAGHFAEVWPGDRRWLAFDVCSERSEIRDMSEPEQAAYRAHSDAIAHLCCDVGLPCISVLKRTGPFDLAANSAMAPFSPIGDDTLTDVVQAFDTAARSGISCGWFCVVDDILPAPNTALDRVLPKTGYRSLVYGPEHSGLVPELARMLTGRGHEVWLLSDGVTPDTLAHVPSTTRPVTFAELLTTYRAATEPRDSA